jgi:hypothetical protein
LVWHLVGISGAYEARKKIMRAWGAWHYPIVDSLPDPLHFFPMDSSRVLAFDQRTAAALTFADARAATVAVRRLAMLAAAAGRTAAHPLVDCEGGIYEPDTVPARVVSAPLPDPPPSDSICVRSGCLARLVHHVSPSQLPRTFRGPRVRPASWWSWELIHPSLDGLHACQWGHRTHADARVESKEEELYLNTTD